MDFKGRRIIVSGAASGIGRATAEALHAHGCAVGMLDRAETLPVELSGGDVKPAYVRCDVTDAAGVAAAVADIAWQLGGIDGVVNAAGVSLRRSLEETTPDDWGRVISINLTGPYNICRAVLPYLREAGGGTIVNVASGAAFRPSADFSAYCASKGGLVAFTKALAFDLAAAAIRANCVCPGVVDTPMIEQALRISPEPEAAMRRFLDASAMKRMGTAREIANVILFLSSNASSYVNGAAYSVDGGGAYH